ncbi:MAG: MgtC/SapB family protein [Erysipelotrichales bacterium]|nr:MgtC/SapB family protein [Erysipelotrichales bacterium]
MFYQVFENILAEILLRLFISFVIGFIIGFEREKNGHPAGLKTHILVCVGATLVMLTSIYGFENLSDPSRLAAQVVSGMGFIGAGAIMRDDSGGIKGITTAATLWVTAMIGLSIGTGMYIPAVAAVFLVTVSLLYIRRFEGRFIRRNIYLSITCRKELPVTTIILQILEDKKLETIDLNLQHLGKNDSGLTKVTITLENHSESKVAIQEAITEIREQLDPKHLQIVNL